MTRRTIDIGIDLGTTNSAVAITVGHEVAVCKNNENQELTPSAVGVDRRGNKFCGIATRNMMVYDPLNVASEFKRRMGMKEPYRFLDSGATLGPEELSAEILKSLRSDAQTLLGTRPEAAVITVPAAFDLPESTATRAAATLAGFTYVELLQEPIAAAIAYGVKSLDENRYWLVYDLGGGTFDSALIRIKDGSLQVVDHEGDNNLGGSDIDWAIVTQILAPKITKSLQLQEFRRGVPQWDAPMRVLKRAAEDAKISLSRQGNVRVDLHGFLQHIGSMADLEIELSTSELESIVDRIITQSLNCCRKLLTRQNLRTDQIDALLLVGGPTLSPYLRKRLSDASTGLDIPLRHDLDPMTVVARGAALYASTRLIPVDEHASRQRATQTGTYSLKLDYKPVGADPEPVVLGSVIAPSGESLTGFTVQFKNAEGKPPWQSAQIRINEQGSFMTSLWTNSTDMTTFRIELRDRFGTLLPCDPSQLTYRYGLEIGEPPLPHGIGIALNDGQVDFFFEKGTPLPAQRTKTYKQSAFVQKGGSGRVTVPLVEGTNRLRAERNRRIGYIDIVGSEVLRDIPSGADVEVTCKLDQSRQLEATAYIPLLDKAWNVRLALQKETPSVELLQLDVRTALRRLEEYKSKQGEAGISQETAAVKQLEEEAWRAELQASLQAAAIDPAAGKKCAEDLVRFNSALDEVASSLEFPTLCTDARKALSTVQELVGEEGSAEDAERLAQLRQDVETDIRNRDADHLHLLIEQIYRLGRRLYWRRAQSWKEYFRDLRQRRLTMSNQTLVSELLDQGDDALVDDDLETLKSVVRQLHELLPVEDRQVGQVRGFGSTLELV